jgi:gliding motility-associated lipoprotein GldH
MIKGTDRYSLVFVFASFFLLLSCNSNVMFTNSLVMPQNKWGLLDKAEFKVDVSDTINSYDVLFVIRTGSSYPFRNIHLFVSTISPEGKSITDTLQYFLADEKGNRFGKGFGEIRELNLPYKKNVYFPAKGTYQFKIQHGMRSEDLVGVYDAGLRIVKVRN